MRFKQTVITVVEAIAKERLKHFMMKYGLIQERFYATQAISVNYWSGLKDYHS